MPIINVIKYEGDNKTFVWRHPATDFNTGSQLIVHESQQAIFMANGEILDVFSAGKHILETGNLPIIKRVQSLTSGGVVQFHAELYFVNLTEQMAIKWGTDSKIQYLDPEYNFPLEIGASGEMSLAVSNSQKLLVKVVGTEKNLSQQQLTIYFRAFIMNRIKSIIPAIIIEKKISIFNIDQHLTELSEAVQEKLDDDFFDYGVALKRFLITTVVKPDYDKNYLKFKNLHYRKYTDVAEAELQQKLSIIEQQTKAQQTVIEAEAIAKKRELEGYTYQQEKGFEVAKEMARNEAIGQMNNVGVGLGMMAGVGGTIGRQVGQMATGAMESAVNTTAVPQQPAPALQQPTARFCIKCGHQLSAGAIFCEKCGAKQGEGSVCAKCGNPMSEEAVFCPICGTKRG